MRATFGVAASDEFVVHARSTRTRAPPLPADGDSHVTADEEGEPTGHLGLDDIGFEKQELADAFGEGRVVGDPILRNRSQWAPGAPSRDRSPDAELRTRERYVPEVIAIGPPTAHEGTVGPSDHVPGRQDPARILVANRVVASSTPGWRTCRLPAGHVAGWHGTETRWGDAPLAPTRRGVTVADVALVEPHRPATAPTHHFQLHRALRSRPGMAALGVRPAPITPRLPSPPTPVQHPSPADRGRVVTM